MAGSNPYRVGIIGGGPRGEWAAEELINRAHRDGARFVIDVWEPFEVGSGQVCQSRGCSTCRPTRCTPPPGRTT